MKDQLERLILLPFAAGCISKSWIPGFPAVTPHDKRSKQCILCPGCEEKYEEEDGCLDDEEIFLSGQNWKPTLPRFQKLFKNFSQLFIKEPGMEIGLPTDVKHVRGGSWMVPAQV